MLKGDNMLLLWGFLCGTEPFIYIQNHVRSQDISYLYSTWQFPSLRRWTCKWSLEYARLEWALGGVMLKDMEKTQAGGK